MFLTKTYVLDRNLAIEYASEASVISVLYISNQAYKVFKEKESLMYTNQFRLAVYLIGVLKVFS